MDIDTEQVFLAGKEVGKTAESVKYVKALRADQQVNVLLTYREAEIYSGDILVIEEL